MEDFPIREIPEVAGWSENFCLAGYDPTSGIDLFLHIGRWRKDPHLWRETIAIALPDGTIATHRAIGRSLASVEGPGGPLLKVRVTQDHQQQTWSFDGATRRLPALELRAGLPSDGPMERVSFDLDFGGVAPIWNISKVGHKTDFMGAGHVEQLGRVTGPIRIGEESYEFDGVLNRDHSRGPRSFGQNLRHIWMHGYFPNGIGFEAYEAEIIAGIPAFSEVTVIDGGKHYDARLELDFCIPLTGGIHEVQRLIGFKLHYEKGVLDVQAVRFPTTIYGCSSTPNEVYIGMNGVLTDGRTGWVEQSAEYLLDGAITGFGHIERLVPGIWLEEL